MAHYHDQYGKYSVAKNLAQLADIMGVPPDPSVMEPDSSGGKCTADTEDAPARIELFDSDDEFCWNSDVEQSDSERQYVMRMTMSENYLKLGFVASVGGSVRKVATAAELTTASSH
jgi:hypothetical protein